MAREIQNPLTQWQKAISAAIDRRIVDLHTALPGIVQSYDPATQTAEIQIAIQRVKVDGTFEDIPLLPDVPVLWPRVGEGILHFPMAAGDTVLVVFAERDCDNFRGRAAIQPPASARRHSYADAVAIPGFRIETDSFVFDLVDAGSTVLQSGDSKVVLEPAGVVRVGRVGGTQDQPAVLGTEALAVVGGTLDKAVAVIDAVTTGPVGIDSIGGQVTTHPALVAALATIKTALQALKTQYVDNAATNIVSQKTFLDR